jgi:hypothetical protein
MLLPGNHCPKQTARSAASSAGKSGSMISVRSPNTNATTAVTPTHTESHQLQDICGCACWQPHEQLLIDARNTYYGSSVPLK